MEQVVVDSGSTRNFRFEVLWTRYVV
jgi:hypothetical protein